MHAPELYHTSEAAVGIDQKYQPNYQRLGEPALLSHFGPNRLSYSN